MESAKQQENAQAERQPSSERTDGGLERGDDVMGKHSDNVRVAEGQHAGNGWGGVEGVSGGLAPGDDAHHADSTDNDGKAQRESEGLVLALQRCCNKLLRSHAKPGHGASGFKNTEAGVKYTDAACAAVNEDADLAAGARNMAEGGAAAGSSAGSFECVQELRGFTEQKKRPKRSGAGEGDKEERW